MIIANQLFSAGEQAMTTQHPYFTFRKLAWLICIVVFLISAGLLAKDLYQAKKDQNAYEQLALQVQRRDKTSQTLSETGLLNKYDFLWQQNHHLGGWLLINDTPVNYPVMYTPDDPDYYLRRAFDGGYSASGSLFIAEGCSPDTDHVIIYGHHMKNHTMFGSLPLYESTDYAQKHAVIHFDTLTEEREYQVLAAFYSRVYRQDEENVFRYYQYTNLSDPNIFAEYIEQVRLSALYDTGVEAVYGDRLLTLSTCSYHTDNGRFVVIAVCKKPTE